MRVPGSGLAGFGLSRRCALAGAFALAAPAVARGATTRPEPARVRAGPRLNPGTIDVHHHFFPPVFKEASDGFLRRAFGEVPRDIANWTPDADLEAMDRNNIAFSVINTSARPPEPGVSPDLFRTQARQANEFGAKMVQDHPKRFAQFGFLPMPDVDGSLKEIEYVLDVLKAPGVGLMTSYGNRWQGNPAFAPVLEELNRRKAVVFCHPLPAACCTALMNDVAPREPLLVEFPFDTGRAVTSLLMSGSFARFRDIKWIFCHCGDVVPALSGRMRNALSTSMTAEEVSRFAPQGMDFELQRQFYDTADGAYAPSMAAARSYIPRSQLLFGTDYPYVSMERNVQELHDRHLSAAEMLAIQRGNVLRLMPQLRV